MERSQKDYKIFPGWLIVAGGFLIMGTCYAVFVSCSSLFLVPMTTTLGFTRSQFSAGTSISSLVGIFSALVIGKLLDHRSARFIGVLSVVCISLDMLAQAFVTQLWQLYALAFVTGFFALAGTRLLVSILITNWFESRRGFAVSLALMGSGVGGAILTTISGKLIDSIGWQHTWMVLAVITAVCSLPLVLTSFITRPSDVGLVPHGSLPSATPDPASLAEDVADADRVSAWATFHRTPAFWIFLAAFFLLGMDNGGVIQNISAQLTDAGHTTEFAASILSIELLVVIVGKLTTGAIFDRFGAMAGVTFGSVTTILGIGSLFFSSGFVGPFAFAIFFGFGTCLATVAPPLIVVEEFGIRHLGSLTGMATAAEMVGIATSAPMLGAIHDRQNSYNLGWGILIVAGIVMLVLFRISVSLTRGRSGSVLTASTTA